MNPIKASLVRVNPPAKPGETAEIPFAFNPERVTISHEMRTVEVASGATDGAIQEQIRGLGIVRIDIDRMMLVGADTKTHGDALVKWSTPLQSTVDKNVTIPIDLRFSWGAGLSYNVRLQGVTISFTRFAATTGNPIRAEVHLALKQFVTAKPGTNPTSGGPAGRGTRTLDSSEGLPSIAMERYGRPGAWRDIARANGLDDPLRVRPGTLLYLPEPGELADGAGGH